MRHLVTIAGADAESFSLLAMEIPLLLEKPSLLISLALGLISILCQYLKVQRQPELDLTLKKLKSISLKYFSIAANHLPYYTALPTSPSKKRRALKINRRKRLKRLRPKRTRCWSRGPYEEPRWTPKENTPRHRERFSSFVLQTFTHRSHSVFRYCNLNREF